MFSKIELLYYSASWQQIKNQHLFLPPLTASKENVQVSGFAQIVTKEKDLKTVGKVCIV